MDFQPGVVHFDPATLQSVMKDAAQAESAVFLLKGETIETVDDFFNAVRATFPLAPPLVSNRSWEALRDCLWAGLDELQTERITIIWTVPEKMRRFNAKEHAQALDVLVDLPNTLGNATYTVGRPKAVRILLGESPAAINPIVADERGAIMVMGIFMCVFLVGALWYIAGIGDAVLYRERMQEASDAVAFSMAALMARGMNMLVLLNLLMAAIEAIRVAINLIMFATLLLAGINWAIGAALDAVSFGTAGTFFIALGTDLFMFEQNAETRVHDAVSPRVDDALKAIHNVEKGLWNMPSVAQVASLAIVDKYKPPIKSDVLAAAGILISKGHMGRPLAGATLPVTWGTTHKLCMKAFDAVKGVLDAIISGSGSVLLSPVQGLADAVGASDFFCELGDNGQAPDMSGQIASIGQAKCDADPDIKQQCKTAKDDQDAVDALAAQCPGWLDDPPPTIPPPPPVATCPNLPQMNTDAQREQARCDDVKAKCKDGVQNGANQAQRGQVQNPQNNSQGGSTNNQTKGNGNDKTPSKVDHDAWWNGCDEAQILAIEYSDGSAVTYSPKFVNFASRGGVTMNDPSLAKGQLTSASQAEFFYDCPSGWDDKRCDKDEEALWNFHWRARFRLVNVDIFGAAAAPIYLPEAFVAAKIGKQIAYDAAHPNFVFASPAAVQFGIDYLNVTIPPMSMALH